MWFFRLDWVHIIRGLWRIFWRALATRHFAISGRDERLGAMIVLATIPVGITGIALEHTFRTIFAKPVAAAAFLFVNGLILLGAEYLRRANLSRSPAHVGAHEHEHEHEAMDQRRIGGRSVEEIREARASDARIARLSMRDALIVGTLQVAALLAGISRSGITMPEGSGGDLIMRTRPASPFCWQLRRSSPRAC